MTNSHARRFVRSAWTLLTFQTIVSVGAVAVTGLAALHVQRLAAELEAARAPAATESAEAQPEAPGGPRASAVVEAPSDQATSAPSDAATSAPADPAARAETSSVVAACETQRNVIFRVQANTLWCDTRYEVQRGQRIIVAAQGSWSHGDRMMVSAAGGDRRSDTSLSTDAPLGALLGRVGEHVFPIGAGATIDIRTNGTLHLSMNDVPAEMGDNRGFVEVFVQSPATP